MEGWRVGGLQVGGLRVCGLEGLRVCGLEVCGSIGGLRVGGLRVGGLRVGGLEGWNLFTPFFISSSIYFLCALLCTYFTSARVRVLYQPDQFEYVTVFSEFW